MMPGRCHVLFLIKQILMTIISFHLSIFFVCFFSHDFHIKGSSYAGSVVLLYGSLTTSTFGGNEFFRCFRHFFSPPPVPPIIDLLSTLPTDPGHFVPSRIFPYCFKQDLIKCNQGKTLAVGQF